MRAHLCWQKQLMTNDAARRPAHALSWGHVRSVSIAKPLDHGGFEQNTTAFCGATKELALNLLLLPHESKLKLVRDDPALR